jgi:peptidoglycan/LPS O-acetylase OafA/YrhL
MTWAGLILAHGWLVTALTGSVSVLAVLIVILVFTSQAGFIVRVLEWKPLAHLGRISYGFYLYHNFLSFGVFDHSDIFHSVLAVLLNFVVVVIAAEMSWYLIERPLIAFARARTLSLPNRIYNSSVFGELTSREQPTPTGVIAATVSE